MLKSNIDAPYIIRMRSELQDGMYIDLCGAKSVGAAKIVARAMARMQQGHISLTILRTTDMDENGIIWGELA